MMMMFFALKFVKLKKSMYLCPQEDKNKKLKLLYYEENNGFYVVGIGMLYSICANHPKRQR